MTPIERKARELLDTAMAETVTRCAPSSPP